MEGIIIPTETLASITAVFKVLFFAGAGIMMLISYFHIKEARKMENKLKVVLPGSVSLAMSIQLILSIVLLFLSTAVLLFL